MRFFAPLLALLACNQVTAGTMPASTRIKVTVTNGTAGNVLSPYLVALQNPSATLFQVGTPASAGVALIAETGDTSVLESELDQRMTTYAHYKAPGAPIMPGESRSVEFSVPAEMRQNLQLSLIAMIGRSNDSFISLGGIDLGSLTSSITLSAQNFDAGSEENTGNMEDFGPGGHPTAAAEQHVSFDRGLNPRGNAPETWSWGPVAATVTIEVLP